MEIKDLLPHLIYKFNSESDAIGAIKEISEKFTTKRESISDYLFDERLVAAYTLYYFLTNIPKFEGMLKWLPNEFVEELKKSTLIDMGSGPGTFSFAFQDWSQSTSKVYQVELSDLMKKQARLIWNAFNKSDQLIQSVPTSTETNKVMFFGHSSNEMGVDVTINYIKKINPDHIIFLEPGTKEFFSKMLKIRTTLFLNGFGQVYPCSISGPCPMDNQSDWCHQYLRHVHTPELERLGQLLGINRRYMAMTLQVFSKNMNYRTTSSKVVQVLPDTKFSYEWRVCENNILKDIQVMKRGFSKADLKNFDTVMSGDLIDYEVDKVLENGKSRVLLK